MKQLVGYVQIFLFVVYIPRLEIFGLSVLLYSLVLVTFMFMGDIKNTFTIFRNDAKFIVSFMTLFYVYLAVLKYINNVKTVSILVSFGSVFCTLIVIGTLSRNHKQQLLNYRALIVYFAILSGSAFWYFITYISEPLLLLHSQIFMVKGIALPGGFTSWPHIFGYHLTPLALCVVVLWLYSKGIKKVLWSVILSLVLYIVILFGERSVMFSILICLCILILKRDYTKKIIVFTVILLFAVQIFNIKFDRSPSEFQQNPGFSRQINLIEKLTSQSRDEIESRLMLQLIGLEIFFRNPLGLSLNQQDWKTAALVLNQDAFEYWEEVIYIHNGYIGTAVRYGIMIGSLIFIILYKLLLISIRMINFRDRDRNNNKINTVLGISLVGVLVQAMFHNASFASTEPTTITLIIFVLIRYSQISRIKKTYLISGRSYTRGKK